MSFKEWIKTLGIFYFLLLAIISVPILLTFTVISIKTIWELRYWILGGVVCLFSIAFYFLYKHRKRYKEELRKNKEEILEVVEKALSSGHEVNISFMGGMLKISCKKIDANKSLPASNKNVPLLP